MAAGGSVAYIILLFLQDAETLVLCPVVFYVRDGVMWRMLQKDYKWKIWKFCQG